LNQRLSLSSLWKKWDPSHLMLRGWYLKGWATRKRRKGVQGIH